MFKKPKKNSSRSLCLLARMNMNLIVTTPAPLSSPLKLDFNQIKIICLDLFDEKKFDDPLWHVYKFAKTCEGLSVYDIRNDIIKAKLFPHTLTGDVKDWVIKWHKTRSWSNIRADFIEKFGDPKILAGWKGFILGFKQRENETLTDFWEKNRVLIKSTHGLSDWIVLHYFYYGLHEKTRILLDGEGDKLFMDLVNRKIQNSLVRAGIINPLSLGPLSKKIKEVDSEKKKEEESRQVKEIKLLDDIPNDPLASLENCTLDEIVSILQNNACDPHVDYNQADFCTFIANHVIKES
jgi:hypothetical protein